MTLLWRDRKELQGNCSQSIKDLRNRVYEDSKLLVEIVNLVNNKIAEKSKKPTIHQVLANIEEIYLHSLQKDSGTVDLAFADWFIGLVGE